MTFDYSFLFESLKGRRRLRSYAEPWYIMEGSAEVGGADQPVIVESNVAERRYVVECSSCARMPGHGLQELERLIGTPLPLDFLEFYQIIETALIVTRTFPLHIWNETKIISEMRENREDFTQPIRAFRFGEQYNRQAIQFGMWLQNPASSTWRVTSLQSATLDDLDDEFVDEGQILASSFYDWLKGFIDRDGLPDPFMRLGSEGGFLDLP